jgi:hypothetical protein
MTSASLQGDYIAQAQLTARRGAASGRGLNRRGVGAEMPTFSCIAGEEAVGEES